MTNDEMAEMIAERNGSQRFCKNCDDCCQPYNSSDDCFKSAMEAMYWKEEQYKQQLNSLKDEIQNNLCASSGFNDEYSRGYQDCGMKVMEMIDKILEL